MQDNGQKITSLFPWLPSKVFDGPDPLAFTEGEDPNLAIGRQKLRENSPYPDARTGLTDIQTDMLGRRYGVNGEPFPKRFWPFSLRLLGAARHYWQPLDLVVSELLRLVQQVSIYPMFEKLPDYSLLIEILPESAENFHLQRDFFESQELPNLTNFGYELLRDEILNECYPPPVCLPLNLVAGIAFDCTNRRVGTNFPPHNLSEVIDALSVKLEQPKKTDAHAIGKIMKGPDFAAGGTIIADSMQLSKCYGDGEGTLLHRCDILVENDIVRIRVIEPTYALRQLESAIHQGKITGLSRVTINGSEIVAAILQGADLLSIKSRIHEMPGFTTAINFDMTVMARKNGAGPTKDLSFDPLESEKRRMPIDEILQAFIDQRLRFLRVIHELNKTKAVSRMQNELFEFKRNYGSPRRTQIQTPS